MAPNDTPAVAGGAEALEIVRLLTSLPSGPVRDRMLETLQQTLVANSPTENAIEAEVDLLTRGLPAFIRLPKPKTRCPHTGLTRTGMTELVVPGDRNDHKPPVKAIYKRSHSRSKRGVWHIPARNLFRYLLLEERDSIKGFFAMREARKKDGELSS